jgi:hypothetical protein
MTYGGYVIGFTADRIYCRRLIDAGYDPAERRSNGTGRVTLGIRCIIRSVLYRLPCWQDTP